jgi:hypothetical protein
VDSGENKETEARFKQVVGYFLGHSKPKDEPKPKKQKAASKAKKASTKATKPA